MLGAVAVWALSVGYALLYTGGAWFHDSATAPSLGAALGMSQSSVYSGLQAETGNNVAGHIAASGLTGSPALAASGPSVGPGGAPSSVTASSVSL